MMLSEVDELVREELKVDLNTYVNNLEVYINALKYLSKEADKGSMLEKCLSKAQEEVKSVKSPNWRAQKDDWNYYFKQSRNVQDVKYCKQPRNACESLKIIDETIALLDEYLKSKGLGPPGFEPGTSTTSRWRHNH